MAAGGFEAGGAGLSALPGVPWPRPKPVEAKNNPANRLAAATHFVHRIAERISPSVASARFYAVRTPMFRFTFRLGLHLWNNPFVPPPGKRPKTEGVTVSFGKTVTPARRTGVGKLRGVKWYRKCLRHAEPYCRLILDFAGRLSTFGLSSAWESTASAV
jgi:hypothetical protein